MRKHKDFKLTKYSPLFAIIIAVMGINTINEAVAQSAGDVLNKMEPDQSASYINGVVEGLAFARWVKDKPDKTGMQCIYDWYYRSDTETNFKTVMSWLERHPDKPVGGLMYVLIKKECGV